MVCFRESPNRSICLCGALTLLSLMFFVIDLTVPLGVAGGVPYALVVFLSAWLPWRRAILVFGVATSMLVAWGLMWSPPTEELWKALVNRSLALLVIWATAILVLRRQQTEDSLKSVNTELEQRAAEHEATLNSVLHHAPRAVIIVDDKGFIDSINDSAKDIFGYSPEELCGKHFSILMPEPYKSRYHQYIAAYSKVGQEKTIDTNPREIEGITRQGTTLPLQLRISRINVNGKLIFIQQFTRI